MTTAARHLCVAWAALGLLIVGASPAVAGSARLDLSADSSGRLAAELMFRADPGERNNVQVALERPPSGQRAYLLRDAGPIDAGAGCSTATDPNLPTAQLVSCPIPGNARLAGVRLRLGDLDDTGVGAGGPRDQVYGEAGDDDLSNGALLDGGGGNDFLQGGRGRARLAGGPGDDTINGGDGADRTVLGPGNDVVNTLGDEGSLASDRLDSRDAAVDEIYCYRRDRHDRLVVDGIDFLDGCGSALRNSPSIGVPIDIRPDGEDDRGAIVTIGCSDDGPRVCRGSYTVLAGRRRLSEDRFRVTRSDATLGVETDSQLTPGALLRLGRVRIALTSYDRHGQLHRISLRLPVARR